MFLDNFNYSVLGANSDSRIVFIHGLMAFSANWRKITNRLEDSFQCLIYDQRGHGRSFKPESGYSPEVFAEDLNKITDELGWDHFHLVGHSMGGRNAMVFAHLYPKKVRSLTVEDIGPDADAKSYMYYEDMLNSVPTPFLTKQLMKDFFNQTFSTVFIAKESPSILSLFLQSNIEEKPGGLFDWKFSKEAIIAIVREGHEKDRWLEVNSFKMPVLLIRGQNSHVLKPETFEKMLLSNRNIQGVQIAGAGHWVHYDKFEEFTTVLKDFIQLHNA